MSRSCKALLTIVVLCLTTALLPMSPARAEAGHDDEYELLQLVNNERAANGLRPVQMDGRLQGDARNWSEHLLHVRFEHDPNMPWYNCTFKSENVASGHTTVAQVHSGFMNSAGHRANILRPEVTVAGFGVYYSASGAMSTVERFYACSSVAPAQSTSGAIKAKWLALGGAPSYGRFQGAPAGTCLGGQYQVFGGGSDSAIPWSAIYQHPGVDAGRAHVAYGAIGGLWGQMRDACGPLGFPTTDPFSISYCRGQLNPTAQGFQGGLIEASDGTGAHALVPGHIYNRFAATNGHCGVAGLPTSGVFDWPGDATWRGQRFEFRYIAEYKPTGQTFICTYQGACTG